MKRERCTCGALICPSWRRKHRAARRHLLAHTVRLLRARGLSDAEIGRQLRISRAYVGRFT